MSENKKQNLAKTAVLMGIIILFSKVAGLVRDMLVASSFGTTEAAIAYTTASKLPLEIFDFVLGAAVTSAFIPIYNSIAVKKGKKEALAFSQSYVNLILVITSVITLVGVIFAPYLVRFIAPELTESVSTLATNLTRIMFPMVIFVGLAFSFVGFLQSEGEYNIPAVISLVSNGIMIIYLIFFAGRFGVTGLSVAMVIGWGTQAAVQIPAVIKRGFRFRITAPLGTPEIAQAAKNSIPILIATWVTPVCAFINSIYASGIDGGRAINALGYSNKLYIIIVGLFSLVATNLLFPYFAHSAAKGGSEENDRLTRTSIKILVFIIAPIAVGVGVLSKEFIALVYERGEFNPSDTLITAEAMRSYAVGMLFAAVGEVLTKAFFAVQKTLIPMISSLISIAMNIIVILIFGKSLGIGGIALVSGLATALNMTLNYIFARRHGLITHNGKDIADIVKSLLSSGIMGVSVYFTSRYLGGHGKLIDFILPVLVGVVIYALSSLILRSDEMTGLIGAVKGKFIKRKKGRPKMIKVLNILSDSNIGGAGRLLVNYLRNFDREKFDVAVVLPKDSDLKPSVEETGFRVFEIEHGRDKSFDMKAVREVMAIIKKWQPDVVHTHSSFYGKLAAYLCGTKARFYTRHSAFPQPKKLTTFPGKQINGFINGTLSTHIVAVAQAAMDNLTDTGVKPEKITVIINGVDEVRRTTNEEQAELKRSLGIGDSTFVCGISARLESYKGHSYLLRSAKTVTEKHPDTVFLIIGGGTCEAELKQQALDLGIADKVIFTGFVDDVAPYYNIMNLNLNCSIGTETSSLALSEGFSLSVPAVASDYGGNPYMVTDGVNGYIVPERDPDAMAEKIIQLIEDRGLLAKLSEGAREMYEKKFTAAVMTRQLEALYEKAVAEKKK